MTMVISDVQSHPEFLSTVADRIWQAWWKNSGTARDTFEADLRKHLEAGGPVLFSLVAHDAGAFLGTVLLVASDEPARPQYTPWIAALWVDGEHRERGVGTALVEEAVALGARRGVRRFHLAASSLRRSFYEKRGWTLVEADVPAPGMHIFTRDA